MESNPIKINQQFGLWKVLRKAENDRKGNARWICRCSCGNEKSVYQFSLKNGQSRSCGCANYKNLKRAEVRHGLTGTRLHQAWIGMRRRCLKSNDNNYKNYGGRGIKICKEWDLFENFMDWSLENGYSEELSIDRIDNDGDYKPSNCRWTTPLAQANNRRVTVKLKYKGVTRTLKQWANIVGTQYQTLYARRKRGWNEETILFGKASRITEG